MQCIIGALLAAGSLAMPESPRYIFHFSAEFCSYLLGCVRWLIDNDRDAEGLRVIVDLHGGDPQDLIALSEYEEIKERVMLEVCISLCMRGNLLKPAVSAKVARHEHTQ